MQRENSAGIVVALDDSPAGEIRRGHSCATCFAGRQFPDAHFAHQISGGEKLAVAAEGDACTGGTWLKLWTQLAGPRIVDAHRRLALRQRLILVAAADVLPGDRRDQRAVR